jgi:hypothetical protein
MTAPVQIGAARIATDTAGSTGSTPAPVYQLEAPLIDAGNSLHDLFAGGVHPEAPAWDAAVQQIHRATDSFRGPHGGLQPLRNGAQAPGPAGGTAVTAQVTAATTAGVARARTWLGRQVASLRVTRG